MKISHLDKQRGTKYNGSGGIGGIELLSVAGHLDGREPMVKPIWNRSVFMFSKGVMPIEAAIRIGTDSMPEVDGQECNVG